MLTDLERADDPQGGGMERWSGMCERAGVRLEDCTVALSGTLPQSCEEYEEESLEDEYSYTDEEVEVAEEPTRPGGVGLAELRALLGEGRIMSKEREDPPFGLAY